MGSNRGAKGTNERLIGADRKAVVERYRSAVQLLMEAKYDWELTAAHVARQRGNPEYEARCYTISRELRRRIEPFRHIEPDWFAKLDEQLYNEFVERDQRNIVQERTGRTDAPKR